MMHGKTSKQMQKTSGLKSRLLSKARPQGSNKAGTLSVSALWYVVMHHFVVVIGPGDDPL